LTIAGLSHASVFTCDTSGFKHEKRNVENIADLRPSDVTMMMAFGDSITAGFSIRGGVYEDRNLSWSIGQGSRDQLTLPWITSQYSGSVKGASTERRLPVSIKLPYGDYYRPKDRLNFAQPQAAVALGSMHEQWEHAQKALSKRDFKAGRDFRDYNEHWKVITIWMTANDVCSKCKEPLSEKELERWAQPYEELLHNISITMDKVYVNLISTLDLSHINRIQKTDFLCKFVHGVIIEEAGCIDRGTPEQLKQIDENIHTMNARLHKMAQDWYEKLKKQGRKDMAVVMQSFMEGVGHQLDRSFLSKLDCFHPAEKAHAALATGLWNSMLCKDDREHHCGVPFSLDMKPTCPGPEDTFYTGPDVVPVV